MELDISKKTTVKIISDFLKSRPKCFISDTFVIYFGFLLWISTSDKFVKHLGWHFGLFYTVTCMMYFGFFSDAFRIFRNNVPFNTWLKLRWNYLPAVLCWDLGL